MLFEKENKPHHRVYKIGNIKLPFPKSLPQRPSFLRNYTI